MEEETPSLEPIEIDERTFLREHFALPPLPEVSARIMEKISSGDTGPNEVATLLSSDAALVALVFKLVNSAYYSLPRRIEKINQAVAFLGLSEINRLVMALSVMKTLAPPNDREFHRFWRHSFYSALVSRHVARAFYRALELEGLYTAVLLHDIGKLVYMKFFPGHWSAIRRYCGRHECYCHQAEKFYSLPSHQEFGELLCERWQLPDTVRRACAFHELHQLEEAAPNGPKRDFEAVAAVSNLMAHLGAGGLNDELKERTSAQIQRTLGCGEEDFLVSMGEVYELQESVDTFLARL